MPKNFFLVPHWGYLQRPIWQTNHPENHNPPSTLPPFTPRCSIKFFNGLRSHAIHIFQKFVVPGWPGWPPFPTANVSSSLGKPRISSSRRNPAIPWVAEPLGLSLPISSIIGNLRVPGLKLWGASPTLPGPLDGLWCNKCYYQPPCICPISKG